MSDLPDGTSVNAKRQRFSRHPLEDLSMGGAGRFPVSSSGSRRGCKYSPASTRRLRQTSTLYRLVRYQKRHCTICPL